MYVRVEFLLGPGLLEHWVCSKDDWELLPDARPIFWKTVTASPWLCRCARLWEHELTAFSPLSFLDGDGRRLKGAIQRSTETGLAVEMPSRTVRQASHESIEDSMNSYGSEGK